MSALVVLLIAYWAVATQREASLAGTSRATKASAPTVPTSVATTVPAATTTVPKGPAVRTATAPPPHSVTPAAGPGWAVSEWVPAGPGVATTLLVQAGRPAVAVTRLDSHLLRFALYAGTADPAGAWVNRGAVPPAQWPTLVATFNSGFKISASRGGWFAAGRSAAPLRAGAASMVIYQDGSATVGMWGRDAQMSATVAAVRQNLELLVDAGRPAANVSTNIQPTWGFTLGGGGSVWRSAVGVDGTGRVLYAAGPSLDPATLAGAMMAAGAGRAMELDINPQWVSCDTFTHDPAGLVATKLLPSMSYPATHFLTASNRDFFAVFTRS